MIPTQISLHVSPPCCLPPASSSHQPTPLTNCFRPFRCSIFLFLYCSDSPVTNNTAASVNEGFAGLRMIEAPAPATTAHPLACLASPQPACTLTATAFPTLAAAADAPAALVDGSDHFPPSPAAAAGTAQCSPGPSEHRDLLVAIGRHKELVRRGSKASIFEAKQGKLGCSRRPTSPV